MFKTNFSILFQGEDSRGRILVEVCVNGRTYFPAQGSLDEDSARQEAAMECLQKMGYTLGS